MPYVRRRCQPKTYSHRRYAEDYHLRYRINDMNPTKNLSPHTAAMIPTDTRNMTPAGKGMPPHNARPPARTTPNINLSKTVTVFIITSHHGQSVQCQNVDLA